MHLFIRARGLLLLALVLLLSTGCRASIRAAAAEAPHAAVPAAIDESLKAGEDPHTRERVAAVLATPEMQQAIATIAKAAVAAALVEATSEASQERVAELTDVVAHALAQSIATEIVPAVVTGTRESLGRTMQADMSAVERTVQSLAVQATRAAMREVAAEMPTTVAPAMRESLVRERRAPDLHDAVSGIVSDATRRALVTSREAYREARVEDEGTGAVGLVERLHRLLSLSWVLALVMGAVGVALVVRILQMRRRTRRFRQALLELVSSRAGDRESEPDPARMQRICELLQ